MNHNPVTFEGKMYVISQGEDGVLIFTPVNSMKNTRRWANSILTQYKGQFKFVKEGRCIYALSAYDDSPMFGGDWGIAVCREIDDFDDSIGRAIAVCRALDIEDEIPSYILGNA